MDSDVEIDAHYIAALVNDYQTSGRFHPYTCGCPTPIRDLDPPKATYVAAAGVYLLCRRCGWSQEVTDDMARQCNAVMAMPETTFGDVVGRDTIDPRPALSYNAWKAAVVAGAATGASVLITALLAIHGGSGPAVVWTIAAAFGCRRLLFDSNHKATERINHG